MRAAAIHTSTVERDKVTVTNEHIHERAHTQIAFKDVRNIGKLGTRSIAGHFNDFQSFRMIGGFH